MNTEMNEIELVSLDDERIPEALEYDNEMREWELKCEYYEGFNEE